MHAVVGLQSSRRAQQQAPREGILASRVGGAKELAVAQPKQEAPIVVSSNSDPHDVDTDGIAFDIDPVTSITAPPLPRSAPVVAPTGRKRKR
jgi:hypothetical protein